MTSNKGKNICTHLHINTIVLEKSIMSRKIIERNNFILRKHENDILY